jgi:hypothetical protein
MSRLGSPFPPLMLYMTVSELLVVDGYCGWRELLVLVCINMVSDLASSTMFLYFGTVGFWRSLSSLL